MKSYQIISSAAWWEAMKHLCKIEQFPNWRCKQLIYLHVTVNINDLFSVWNIHGVNHLKTDLCPSLWHFCESRNYLLVHVVCFYCRCQLCLYLNSVTMSLPLWANIRVENSDMVLCCCPFLCTAPLLLSVVSSGQGKYEIKPNRSIFCRSYSGDA